MRFAAAAVAGAAASPARAFAQQQNVKLRVAGIPIDVGGAAYYAQDMGFFAKYGIDAEVVTLANGAAVAAAVAGNALDVGDGNSIAIATAHEHGIPFKLIAPSGAYSKDDPVDGLLVASASPINGGRDLNGKTIAVNALKNIAEIYTRAWIDKNGGDSSTCQFLELGFPEMGAAVLSGRVAAAAVEEPFLTAALGNPGLRQISSPGTAIAPVWIEGGYFVTASFAQAHPDAIRRVAQAIRDANDWADKNLTASLAILSKYSKTTATPKHRCYYPPRLDAAQLQPLIDAAAHYGVLKGFPAKDLIIPGLA